MKIWIIAMVTGGALGGMVFYQNYAPEVPMEIVEIHKERHATVEALEQRLKAQRAVEVSA